MKKYTVAILGATGAVGQEMRKRLEERNFPVGRLKLLASTRSAGKTVMFRGQNIPIEEANEAAFQGVDLVLGAAENEVAIRFAPAIRAAGAVFVDNSSAFRMDPTVPLVVPEVNPQDAALHTGIGGQSQLLHHHHRDRHRRAQPAFTHPEYGGQHLSGSFRGWRSWNWRAT